MTSPNNLLAGEAMTDEQELLAKFLEFADADYVPNTLFDRARALLSASKPAAPETRLEELTCLVEEYGAAVLIGGKTALPRQFKRIIDHARSIAPAAPAQSGEAVAQYQVRRKAQYEDGRLTRFQWVNADPEEVEDFLARDELEVRKLYEHPAALQPFQPVEAGETHIDTTDCEDCGTLGVSVGANCPRCGRLIAAPSAVVLDDERAAFEAWAKGRYSTRYIGTYMDRTADAYEYTKLATAALDGWQARAASPQATATQPAQTRALTDLIAALNAARGSALVRLDADGVNEYGRLILMARALLAAQPASGGDHE